MRLSFLIIVLIVCSTFVCSYSIRPIQVGIGSGDEDYLVLKHDQSFNLSITSLDNQSIEFKYKGQYYKNLSNVSVVLDKDTRIYPLYFRNIQNKSSKYRIKMNNFYEIIEFNYEMQEKQWYESFFSEILSYNYKKCNDNTENIDFYELDNCESYTYNKFLSVNVLDILIFVAIIILVFIYFYFFKK